MNFADNSKQESGRHNVWGKLTQTPAFYTNIILPGARVVAQLVHVWVVLGHNGDGVTLLPDDETGLLLCRVPQVDAIILEQKEEGNVKLTSHKNLG